ncbi:mechanosensitive ion channel protein [Hamiltosporidium magnivora]|uniref:Mechanosensitive ion channel protein n=1 Tax=Hamiltosporidium magnivora TaxID=148818 RepID=A0A4Q9LGD3_9MICR|nr:mechanosensitive ion channel protein [Hamiltosporidium magnivora]
MTTNPFDMETPPHLHTVEERNQAPFNMSFCDNEVSSDASSEKKIFPIHEPFLTKTKEFLLNLNSIKYLKILILAVIFLIGTFFSGNRKVFIKTDSPSENLKLSTVLFFLFKTTISHVFISFVISTTSLYLLQKIDNSTTIFYTHEISNHISLLIILISINAYFFISDKNFYLENKYGIDINLRDMISISIISVVLFTTKRIVVKSISHNFNYSNFIDRIKRVLLFEYFINLIENSVKKPKNRSNNSRRSSFLKNLSFLIFKKVHFSSKLLFESKAIEDNIYIKRAILKDFQSTRAPKFFMSDGDKLDSKAKTYASKRENKINICLEQRNHLSINDLSKYFKDKKHYDRFLQIIQLPGQTKIKNISLKPILETLYKERYILRKSLFQMSAALGRVNMVLNALIIIFTFAMVFVKTSGKTETVISVLSAMFGTGFVFQSSVKNAIDSLIFLFCIHPFDIGDRVIIELDKILENLVVTELNVFSTVFHRWDGTLIYVPNSVLCEKSISNIRRSGVIAETHLVTISYDTPEHKIKNFKSIIRNFLRLNQDNYNEYFMLNFDTLENTNKLNLKVYMQYKSNYQNYEVYLTRRSKFIALIVNALRYLKIEYKLPRQPVLLENIENLNNVQIDRRLIKDIRNADGNATDLVNNEPSNE